jgi:hypothetical protein
MNALVDIIRDVKDNKKPDYEDLRYAVLALTKLNANTQDVLLNVNENTSIKDFHSKRKRINLLFAQAMYMPPKEYIDWKDDPENPEYQKYREVSKRVLARFGAHFKK